MGTPHNTQMICPSCKRWTPKPKFTHERLQQIKASIEHSEGYDEMANVGMTYTLDLVTELLRMRVYR